MPDGGQQVTGTEVSVPMYQLRTGAMLTLTMASQFGASEINLIYLQSGSFFPGLVSKDDLDI